MFRVTNGYQAQNLRSRIAYVRNNIARLLQSEGQAIGEEIRQALAESAPRSAAASSGQSVPGDASSGPLAESFVSEVSGDHEFQVQVVVRTTQPGKLTFVRYGTGIYGPLGTRIVPRTKRALYWPDADHPVRSIAGQPANDFVTPVLDGAGEEAGTRIEEIFVELMALLEN